MDYAFSKNLDLVEVAAQADPPVARVMDYGKYRYEQEQKAKLARKHQIQINIKEIKLRPKIGIHDYNTKKGHVERFLNQRAKVKVTIMFRGREQSHPERGRDLLMRLAEDVKEIGQVESPPLQDGRNMVMVLGPTKNAGVKKTMPKTKTHSGAKKRFKVTATGKLLRRRAMKSHLLEKKSAKRKRGFRKDAPVAKADTKSVKKLLGRGCDATRQAFRSRAQEAPQGSRAGEGLLGAQEVLVPLREGAGRALAPLRVPRPQEQEAHVPAALDHPHQRGRAAERALVQPVHGRPAQGGDRARPQGARGARGERPAGLRRDRRAGEVRARSVAHRRTNETLSPEQARQCEGRSPLYVELCRRFADDPVVTEIVGAEPAWDAPLRLLGGLHYLVLGGEAAWDDPLEAHADFLREFVATQGVQTNEVQRSWMLLPCFLRAARAPARTSSTSSSWGRARA